MAEDLAAEKAALRKAALARRAALTVPAEAPAHRLLPLLQAHRSRILSAYWPMRAEADPRPALAAHPGPICLPVVVARGQPLIFRGWRPGEPLAPAGFGTEAPASGPELLPEVLIVPLLAFDRQGTRLGYGGGFYDRTLQALRTSAPRLAIGLAFAAQEVSSLPREVTDQPLDLIVTEAEVIDLR